MWDDGADAPKKARKGRSHEPIVPQSAPMAGSDQQWLTWRLGKFSWFVPLQGISAKIEPMRKHTKFFKKIKSKFQVKLKWLEKGMKKAARGGFLALISNKNTILQSF